MTTTTNEKPSIVCIGLPKWEGDYLKSTVQLMSEMAAWFTVLYVEYTQTIKDTKGFKNGLLREVKVANGGKLYVLTPPSTLPINWITDNTLYDWGLTLNAKMIEKSIRQAMQQLNIQNPIVINAFQPAYGVKLLGKLNEKSTTYYCYDEIAAAEWCKKHGEEYEYAFMKKVNQVIVSSTALLEKKSQIQPNCFLVKNGVDLGIFKTNKSQKNTIKTIGYVGSIDNRLDVQLLENLIQHFPENPFLFVGRIVDEHVFKTLNRFENVRFEGAKNSEELPEFINKIDIGLIPFKKNEFTRAIYPLKINEYLASGMPVVATDFADLSDFEAYIYSTKKDDFIAQLKKAIEEDNQEIIQNRIQFAEQNTWKNRALAFSKIIQ